MSDDKQDQRARFQAIYGDEYDMHIVGDIYANPVVRLLWAGFVMGEASGMERAIQELEIRDSAGSMDPASHAIETIMALLARGGE